MVYAASTDGQLHAFKVSATSTTDTMTIDRPLNNELWSFIPPRVLPSLLPNYNSQVVLLDGRPVISDVVFNRTVSGPVNWKRVLVAGGGKGGGFYYALDVTDATAPKFLWQI